MDFKAISVNMALRNQESHYQQHYTYPYHHRKYAVIKMLLSEMFSGLTNTVISQSLLSITAS